MLDERVVVLCDGELGVMDGELVRKRTYAFPESTGEANLSAHAMSD